MLVVTTGTVRSGTTLPSIAIGIQPRGLVSGMNGTFVDGHRCFLDCFGERGVSVAAPCQVFTAGSKIHGDRNFVDELTGVGTDDMYTQDSVCLCIGKDLDEAIGMTAGTCSTIGCESKFSCSIFSAGRFQTVLCFTGSSNFRLSVDHSRDDFVIDMTEAGKHSFNAGDAFFFGFVGQHGSANDVTDRINSAYGCLVAGTDTHKSSLVSLHADGIKSEGVDAGPSADGNKHAITNDGVGTFDGDGSIVPVSDNGCDFGSGAKLKSLSGEDFSCFCRNLFVNSWQDSWQVLKDGDFCAQSFPDGSQLESDNSTANDNKMFGNFGPGECFGTGSDAIAVQFNAGQLRGNAASRNQNSITLNLLTCFTGVYRDDSVWPQRSASGEYLNLVLSQEPADASIESLNDTLFVLHHLRQIDLR